MSGIEEFWEAINNFKPEPPIQIEHRGLLKGEQVFDVISEPKEQHREDEYIILTRAEYLRWVPHYSFYIDGKFITILPQDPNQLKLEKTNDGEYCTVKDNMIFVSDFGDKYKKIVRYG